MAEPVSLETFARFTPEEKLTEIYSTQLRVLEEIRTMKENTVDDATMAEFTKLAADIKRQADAAQEAFGNVGKVGKTS